MDKLIIYGAKYLVVVPLLIAFYVLWRTDAKQRKQLIIFVVAVGVLSFALAQIAQHLYVNPRPPFKDGSVPLVKPSDYNGFPSDHTLFAGALAYGLLDFARRWAYLVFGLALLVGWARVAAHVHHLTDIIGALVITAIAYLLVHYLFKFFQPAVKD